jgi:septal ring factor EnvC (AmiA/AmiB activator)
MNSKPQYIINKELIYKNTRLINIRHEKIKQEIQEERQERNEEIQEMKKEIQEMKKEIKERKKEIQERKQEIEQERNMREEERNMREEERNMREEEEKRKKPYKKLKILTDIIGCTSIIVDGSLFLYFGESDLLNIKIWLTVIFLTFIRFLNSLYREFFIKKEKSFDFFNKKFFI